MFNEELNIEHAMNAAVEACTKYTDDYEIIIVDDASTDRSPFLVACRAAENPRIRMIRHEKNRKLGGALKSGFAAATKDLVLYMDADLPFDPDVLGRAMRAMQVTGADVIAGYRLDRTIEGPKRTLYSYVYNALIAVLVKLYPEMRRKVPRRAAPVIPSVSEGSGREGSDERDSVAIPHPGPSLRSG